MDILRQNISLSANLKSDTLHNIFSLKCEMAKKHFFLLFQRPLQSGRPSAPPRPGKSQINKKRLTERNDQVIRGSSGPNQIIHIMSFLQSMEDSQKARTNHIVKTLKKFDEDQKLRNNHILTVIDNLNSNMNR